MIIYGSLKKLCCDMAVGVCTYKMLGRSPGIIEIRSIIVDNSKEWLL